MPSKVLERYLSAYKGIKDIHIEAFRLIEQKYEVKSVLYPGSWIHVTPSLVFPLVVYVDLIANMKSMFKDLELLEYVKCNSEAASGPVIKYHQKDYREGINEVKESFDMLISLNSGFVSQYCKIYLKKNGLLFVNNEHYDAIRAFVDKDYSPIGIFTSYDKLISDCNIVQNYFLTTKNKSITFEMVEENSSMAPSKAKNKLLKIAPFYLFKKT